MKDVKFLVFDSGREYDSNTEELTCAHRNKADAKYPRKDFRKKPETDPPQKFSNT